MSKSNSYFVARGPFSNEPGTAVAPEAGKALGPDLVGPDLVDSPGTLPALGWGPSFAAAFNEGLVEGAVPGRIARVDRGLVSVLTRSGEVRAVVAAEIVNESDPLRVPTVGDWVVLREGTVIRVLPRRSAVVRASAGDAGRPQLLAANVDRVLVVCSLAVRFRPRLLERFVVLACQSGAAPVAVLTKADIARDLAGAVAAAELLIGRGDVVAVSSLTGEGLDELDKLLRAGETVVLLGPSGAGKSTLANRLGCGRIELATGEIRHDSKGRHTTTARELVQLPGGAMLIDTPGLRSLGLFDAEAAIGEAFAEIEELAATCRFSDCAHESEPGCAVRQAITCGELESSRYRSFEKLRLEQRHLATRADPRGRAELRSRYKAVQKAMRASPKH